MKRLIGINILVIVILTIIGCATNPVTGKKEIMLMSESQEIALGKQSDPSIVAQFGLYSDQKIQTFINAKGQEMAKISHRPQLDYEFKVLDSPVVNAFAVPGGYVYFTRGILAHFNNEAEFAGVLGHEIGHVTARHSAKQQSKAQLAQVLFIGGLIASPAFRGMAQEAQQAMGLLFLKFGRDAESQSDRLGVEYSTKIGYDSHKMANFFKTLKRMRDQSGQEIPTFLSTHPDPGDRFNKVNQETDAWQAKIPKPQYKVNRESYLRMIDGLMYGEDPQQGYVENDYFYHPGLKFQYPVPREWQLVNSPTQVQMGDKAGKAMMIFTLSQEKTPQAAAQATTAELKLNVLESKNVTVNGNPAVAVVSSLAQQDPNSGAQSNLRILSYYISYDNNIYLFHGVSAESDFNNYFNTFQYTMKGFNKLTDPNKINVQAERVKVVSVSAPMTLQQVLAKEKVPAKRQEEVAVLNSMMLTDRIAAGTLIKVLSNVKAGS